jgi:ATP-dependent RNA helicase RhlE
MSFSHPGLSDSLCRAADEQGYKDLFPIQAEAFPVIFAGKDLAAAAQTGSGKTAAFLLPILQRLSEKSVVNNSSVKALILVPTRELAVQVCDAAKIFCRYLPDRMKITAVHGGVSINPQMKSLAGGTDILIATPGRLIDLAEQKSVRLSGIEILVLDEADRMLDLGFKDELEVILKMLPVKRQNLLFSATLKSNIEIPGIDFLKNAVKIGAENSEKPADPVEQIVYKVDQNSKGLLLRYLINDGEWEQALVFVSSKRKADNVTRKLVANNITAEALHGDKSQGARTGALTRFKQGKIRVLVATDLASRGLDIEQLPYVVNYELPRSVADYIHRIGRTGRAGVKGVAITLLCEEDQQHMKLIEKRMGRKPVYIDSESISYK